MKRLLLTIFILALPALLLAQDSTQSSPIGFGVQFGLIQDASGDQNLAFNIAFGPFYKLSDGTEIMLAIGAWKAEVQDGALKFSDQEAVFINGMVTQMVYGGWGIQGQLGLNKIDYTEDSEAPVTYAQGYAGILYEWKYKNIGYGLYGGTNLTELQTSFLAGIRLTFH